MGNSMREKEREMVFFLPVEEWAWLGGFGRKKQKWERERWREGKWGVAEEEGFY